MFIKLTTVAGLIVHININHIVFFGDNDNIGCIIKLSDNAGTEVVKEDSYEVGRLIFEAICEQR